MLEFFPKIANNKVRFKDKIYNKFAMSFWNANDQETLDVDQMLFRS